MPQVLQLAVREGVGVGGAGVRSGTTGNATVSSWVVGEEEPVSKLESLELSSNEAAEGCTHIGPRQLVLKKAGGEEVYVTGGVVEGGEPLPGLRGDVARGLIPGAGPLHAAGLSEFIVSRNSMLTSPL